MTALVRLAVIACALVWWSPVLAVLPFAEASGSRPPGQHEGHQPAPVRPAAPAQQEPPLEKVLGWEPIRCWRQASAGAVAIGQSFTVTLTCAAYDADNARVIPDESRLGVASIQMAPFEILGGSHPPDVRRGSRRFFQYDYQLRIISRDAIGRDVNLPALTISYRIHSTVGAAAMLEGRDLSYLMPMMPIKVLSLVPADAADIRDASEASLGAVESLRFRSNLFQVLTLAFTALAAIMVVLALVPLARSATATEGSEPGRLPDRAVLARAASELADVQAQVARETWTDDLISRALGATRVVAAAAIDQPSSQQPVPAGGAVPDGRLLVKHGGIRAITATVSSPITADDLARARTRPGSPFSTTRQQQIEGLQSGLSIMTAALYRKEPARDAAALDEAVRHAMAVAKQIATERSWVNQWARR
jgi:hypothetical protein